MAEGCLSLSAPLLGVLLGGDTALAWCVRIPVSCSLFENGPWSGAAAFHLEARIGAIKTNYSASGAWARRRAHDGAFDGGRSENLLAKITRLIRRHVPPSLLHRMCPYNEIPSANCKACWIFALAMVVWGGG